ncbi:Maf family protein [Paenibacillus ferrarius]|uniref:Maf family protein n=1 Tax=Paenibacillus ferrarius TaxID=1469647 RepID=UPI003D29BFD4
MTNRLILASSSPRRQELIQSFGLPYIIRVSDADETVAQKMSPAQFVETLSLRKAATVRDMLSVDERHGVIIGSDTIVVLQDEILGKPVDRDDAFRMLKALQGSKHQVYSGVACVNAAVNADFDEEISQANSFGSIGHYRTQTEPGQDRTSISVGHTVSSVTFRTMSDEEIWAYVSTGEPLDKAGSYGVQGVGALFIEKIEGDFHSVMGLPLNLLYHMLRMFEINPLFK